MQVVIRPRTAEHPDYRGYAGRVASGVVSRRRRGHRAAVGQDEHRRRHRHVRRAADRGARAAVGHAAARRRRRRGPRRRPGARRGRPSAVGSDLEGTVCWLAEKRSVLGARLLVRIGTRTVRALLREVNARLDVDTLTVEAWDGIDTLHAVDATDTSSDIPPRALSLNAIGRVKIRLAEPVVLDDYATHRRTGGFLLVDPADGTTLAAGMIGATLLDRLAPTRPPDDDDWLAGAGI